MLVALQCNKYNIYISLHRKIFKVRLMIIRVAESIVLVNVSQNLKLHHHKNQTIMITTFRMHLHNHINVSFIFESLSVNLQLATSNHSYILSSIPTIIIFHCVKSIFNSFLLDLDTPRYISCPPHSHLGEIIYDKVYSSNLAHSAMCTR